jgi:hypothetical protein
VADKPNEQVVGWILLYSHVAPSRLVIGSS